MASIPLTGQSLPRFDRGSAAEYVVPLTVDSNLTDPSTWTALRFSVVDTTGARISTDLVGQTTVTASGTSTSAGTDTITKGTVTGSGPWAVTLTIPLSKTQTLFLTSGTCTWQLDYTAAGGGSDDLITESMVQVGEPTVTLP